MSTITAAIRRLVGGGERAASDQVQAVWNGTVLAESERTVVVEGNHYFPREDVRLEHLEHSDSHTLCPWKGVASYYDVVAAGERGTAAAWHYPHPSPLARKIKDHIAFWHDVQIRPAPPSE